MDVDIYVLAKDRSIETAKMFLNNYLPERSFNNGNYEVYSYKDNEEFEFQFDTENEMLKLMSDKENLSFNCSFSPTNENEFLRNIGLYYLSDGGMICSFNIYQNDQKEDILLKELTSFLKSDYGLISYHIAPPNSKCKFKDTVNRINNY